MFAIEALFKPIGVEHWTFEYFDGGGPDGDKRYGRHPSHGLGMPARDLARIAYCMLHNGRWRDKQVVPQWFVEETAAPTHDVKTPELRFNRVAESFSHGWELPARLTCDAVTRKRKMTVVKSQMINSTPPSLRQYSRQQILLPDHLCGTVNAYE